MVRFKNRYLAVKIQSIKSNIQSLQLSSEDLLKEIIEKVKFFHGIYGSSAVRPGLKIQYCNELTGIAIIKARHGPHKLVLSVLPFLEGLKVKDHTVKLLYVGATILQCYKSIAGFQKTSCKELLDLAKIVKEHANE